MFCMNKTLLHAGPPELWYFIMVRNDPLEMDPLASSPILLTNLLPYDVYHSDFNVTENPTHRQGFKNFQLPSQIHLYYCVFLHHEAEKNEADKLEYKYAFTMAYFCLHINFKEGFQ